LVDLGAVDAVKVSKNDVYAKINVFLTPSEQIVLLFNGILNREWSMTTLWCFLRRNWGNFGGICLLDVFFPDI